VSQYLHGKHQQGSAPSWLLLGKVLAPAVTPAASPWVEKKALKKFREKNKAHGESFFLVM
jgi:hypothetical protein